MPDKHFKYGRHQEEWDACINDPELRKLSLTWLTEKNSLDRWRHDNIYSLLKPIIEWNPAASWLTVGDGRYGTDGNALMQMGAENVHCSDLSDTLLKIGAKKGFISSYSSENAEALNFSDNSFEFVYCKEAFHHFPRPYVALDEMFRVASTAVILTEPRDFLIDRGLLQSFLPLITKLMGKRFQEHRFEEVGNYVYTLSEREMEKFLLGMHYTHLAFFGTNDSYLQDIEFVDLRSTDPKDKKLIRQIKTRILLQDILEKLGIRKSGLLSVVLFKKEPNDSLKDALTSIGWRLKNLPKNPYQ
jgi:ubiquinone/menaquinone biosynthesis C-methylase UbiE